MAAWIYMLSIWACLFRLTPSEKNRIITVQQTRFFVDQERSVSIEELGQHPDRYLKFDANFVPADYDPEAAYWVELDFCIDNNRHNYILEFYDQTIDSIQVYVRHESDSNFKYYQFGDQFVFQEREFAHKNFEIALENDGSYLVYVRIVNTEYADIRVAIRPVTEFLNYAIKEYYLYGIFYGMILIISLYNVLIYFAIREPKYLYYTFYILSVGLFAMCVDGIAFQFLWPDQPGWNDIASGYALFSIIIWSFLFSKQFLNLRMRAPRINRLLNYTMVIRTAIFLYGALFDHHVFSYRNIEIIPLLLIFLGSIRVFSRGYKPARFFVVAYGFFVCWFHYQGIAHVFYSAVP